MEADLETDGEKEGCLDANVCKQKCKMNNAAVDTQYINVNSQDP